MENKAFHDNRFYSIQALRGIAALFVILEHVRFLNCGAFGVDIFFVISGFMIMFSTHKSTEHFLRKRFLRILPLYDLMTIGTFALLLLFPSMFEQTKANPVFLLKSLFFIPFDVGGGIIQPLMRIGWTVNYEIFFYLVFCIAFHINHKYRGLICSLLLCALVIISHLVPVSFAPLTFYGDYIQFEFILGILLYYLAWGAYNLFMVGKLPRLLCNLSMLLIPVIFIVLVVTKPHINILGYRRFLVWGIPAVLLVLCAFLAGLKWKLPSPLVQLGDMSYSIYLVHYYPVMLLDRKVFDFSTCTPSSIIGVFLSVLLCLLLSYCSFRLIEKDFTKTCNRWFDSHVYKK